MLLYRTDSFRPKRLLPAQNGDHGYRPRVAPFGPIRLLRPRHQKENHPWTPTWPRSPEGPEKQDSGVLGGKEKAPTTLSGATVIEEGITLPHLYIYAHLKTKRG
ncbi:hypothetical protein QL285_023814 [Trifolium repens]|nr:hypothetical protein QL285_023814 [Trifolium repens]